MLVKGATDGTKLLPVSMLTYDQLTPCEQIQRNSNQSMILHFLFMKMYLNMLPVNVSNSEQVSMC